jgi:hypothetical protein
LCFVFLRLSSGISPPSFHLFEAETRVVCSSVCPVRLLVGRVWVNCSLVQKLRAWGTRLGQLLVYSDLLSSINISSVFNCVDWPLLLMLLMQTFHLVRDSSIKSTLPLSTAVVVSATVASNSGAIVFSLLGNVYPNYS